MARRTVNPFAVNTDPLGTPPEPYQTQNSSYIPQSVGMANPTDTGIPQTSPTQAPQRYQSIVDAYSTYLGRQPSQAEINSQTGNGSFTTYDPRLQQSIYNIRYSPEAFSYATKPASATPATTPPATAPASQTGTASATAPAGWDAGKWANQSHTTPKYVVGRILSNYPDTPEGLQQAMPQIQQAFPGATQVGKDSINIPGIGIVDVGVGFSQGGGQGWAWQPDSDMAGGGAGGAGGAGGYGSGGGFNDAIRQQLMAIMGQSQNPTDSPTYKNAVAAYDVQQQRNSERERNAIAERMAASGQANSGAMDSRIFGAEQARGEATATFAGNLAVRQLERQRDEIMQALQMGANLMTEEQRIALTEKLGLINANLQQQSITNQNNQFTSNMGWEQAQYADMMNRIPWQTIFGAK